MARSSHRKAPQLELDWAQGVAPSGGLAVHRTKEHEHLAKLTKEHERLLRDVARARAALEEAEELARDIEVALFTRLGPIQERLRGIVRDLHALFASLLGPESRLGKRHRGAVREVYDEILAGLPAWALEVSDPDVPSDSEGSTKGKPDEAHARSREPHPDPTRPGPDAGPSAVKTGAAPGSTLRSVFLRLTVALHPDKVQDHAEKERRTRIMQSVTQAYEEGDVARLVELERSHLSPQPSAEEGPEALLRRTEALLRSNTELRRQLRLLTARRKLATRSIPIAIDRGAPGGARKAAERDLDEALAEAELGVQTIEKMRDFVRTFADGKIGVADFLAGPTFEAPDPYGEGVEEEDVLLQVLEMLAAEGIGPPAQKRRPGARRGRTRQR